MIHLTFFLCATFATTSIISVGAMNEIEEITEEDSKSTARHGSSSSNDQDKILGFVGAGSQIFSDANSVEFFNGLVGILTRLKEESGRFTIQEWKNAIMDLDTEGTFKGYVEISKIIVDVYQTLNHLSQLDTAILKDKVQKSLDEHIFRTVYRIKPAVTQKIALPLAKLINSGMPSGDISVDSLAKDVVTVLTKGNAVYQEIHSVFPDTKHIFCKET